MVSDICSPLVAHVQEQTFRGCPETSFLISDTVGCTFVYCLYAQLLDARIHTRIPRSESSSTAASRRTSAIPPVNPQHGISGYTANARMMTSFWIILVKRAYIWAGENPAYRSAQALLGCEINGLKTTACGYIEYTP
ncbi:unnamed protein product, partial [Ectocarpus sp. 6 AP-2014]